jgi:hypothetical protein
MTTLDRIVIVAMIVLLNYTTYHVIALWAERRQPTRKDAPTGNEPWVTPLRVVPPESWRVQR